MSRLKVKTESLPQRCEICHQRDCFDPIENRCLRCQTNESASLITNNIETNLDPFGRPQELQYLELQSLRNQQINKPNKRSLLNLNINLNSPILGALIGTAISVIFGIIDFFTTWLSSSKEIDYYHLPLTGLNDETRVIIVMLIIGCAFGLISGLVFEFLKPIGRLLLDIHNKILAYEKDLLRRA